MGDWNESRYILVKSREWPIDSPDIGQIFISGQMQSDLKHELIDLRIDFYAEKRHDWYCNIIFM